VRTAGLAGVVVTGNGDFDALAAGQPGEGVGAVLHGGDALRLGIGADDLQINVIAIGAAGMLQMA
jgi:hypothetical protein